MTMNKAMQEWLEYKEANESNDKHEKKAVQSDEEIRKWKSPPPGFITLNTDAALIKDKRRTGWGVIARGGDGKLKEVWAGSASRLGEPAIEGALVIRMALVKARQQGWNKVVIQSDCKVIIDKLNEKELDDQAAGVVFG